MLDVVKNVKIDNTAELNEELIEAYTILFKKLVESGNVSAIMPVLSSLKELNENERTKCNILYIGSKFINDACEEDFKRIKEELGVAEGV